MGVVQSGQSLTGVIESDGQRRLSSLQYFSQRATLDQLHNHHQVALFTEGVVNRGYVWMVELCLELDFTQKPLTQAWRAVRYIRRHHLHGLHALGNGVLGLENFAHGSTADCPDNHVRADHVAEFKAHRASAIKSQAGGPLTAG